MLFFSVPPVDGLSVTPGLLSFIAPEYFSAYYLFLDIGKGIASVDMNKAKTAYRFYNKVINLIEDNDTTGGEALIIIPDDWDLPMHIKLATAWLASQERKIIVNRLNDLGYRVYDVLVVRRVIKALFPEPVVDLSPFKQFLDYDMVYGIPMNESTATNTNVKCRYYPEQCVMHARLIINALIDTLQNPPWIHLLGPSPKLIPRFMNDGIKSVDTTGHTSNSIRPVTGDRKGKMNDLAMYMRLRKIITVNQIKISLGT